jgi:pseudaminic acid biosynthesis-associated methylase
MDMTYKTEQEAFWAGEFGNEYIGRNTGEQLLAYNLDFFARAMRHAQGVSSVIEFGANIGMNLKALQLLHPRQQQYGIEINAQAAAELAKVIPQSNVFRQSILDFEPARRWDLALIKTVLIHIQPEQLSRVYEGLYRSAGRYILIAEYYNPIPVEVSYRGHSQRLFKRDFAGEMLEAYPDLRLLDYGFVYRRDPIVPQDDITWFLLEKTSSPEEEA